MRTHLSSTFLGDLPAYAGNRSGSTVQILSHTPVRTVRDEANFAGLGALTAEQVAAVRARTSGILAQRRKAGLASVASRIRDNLSALSPWRPGMSYFRADPVVPELEKAVQSGISFLTANDSGLDVDTVGRGLYALLVRRLGDERKAREQQARLDWLAAESRKRATALPGDLDQLAQQRGEAVQAAVLNATGMPPERVFLSRNGKVSTSAQQVRFELAIQ